MYTRKRMYAHVVICLSVRMHECRNTQIVTT